MDDRRVRVAFDNFQHFRLIFLKKILNNKNQELNFNLFKQILIIHFLYLYFDI
jgi:hypothetical protein